MELNVYQKLANVRNDFLQMGVKKSGKNMSMAFMYFELEDIVPLATKLFTENHLLLTNDFVGDVAIANVINTDKPEETISFSVPFAVVEAIVSQSGKSVTNNCQRLGSTLTYYRRYLWMLVLDLVQADTIDGNARPDKEVIPAQPQAQAQPIAVARQEVVKDLTNADGKADKLMVDGLKALLKEVKAKLPNGKIVVQEVFDKTDKLTNVSKTECEIIVTQLKEQLEMQETLEKAQADCNF